MTKPTKIRSGICPFFEYPNILKTLQNSLQNIEDQNKLEALAFASIISKLIEIKKEKSSSKNNS